MGTHFSFLMQPGFQLQMCSSICRKFQGPLICGMQRHSSTLEGILKEDAIKLFGRIEAVMEKFTIPWSLDLG